MNNRFFRGFAVLLVLLSLLSLGAFASGPEPSPEPSSVPDGGYLPLEEFLQVAGDDYTVEAYAIQSVPNTPVESSAGLKGILLDLFGPYMPTITQLQYRQGSNQYYTYVNDISPDYPWLCSAGIFALVLLCLFKLGGALLCRI